jgi:hypothetical protein
MDADASGLTFDTNFSRFGIMKAVEQHLYFFSVFEGAIEPYHSV